MVLYGHEGGAPAGPPYCCLPRSSMHGAVWPRGRCTSRATILLLAQVEHACCHLSVAREQEQRPPRR